MANLFKDLGEFLGHKFGPVGTALGAVFAGLGPVPIVILGLLVAVIQAFVFMLLTTIYIGMATAHEEH
jgi:F0F1-type ATP synthase membrane subunit a